MKIAFLGDTAFFHNKSLEKINIEQYYSDIKLYLEDCDYIILNLETPLAYNKGVKSIKSANIFSFAPNVKILKYLGVNIVNLANNHVLDYGKKSFQETITILEENKINYFGVKNKDLIIENRIKIWGFNCYSTNGLGYNKVINTLSYHNLKNTIHNNDKFLNIISLHMGEEHVHIPNISHMRLLREALNNDISNIVVGHHPHVVQGNECIGKSKLYYSIGNFIFDDIYVNHGKELLVKRSNDNREGCILKIEVFDDLSYKIEHRIIFDDDKKINLYDENQSNIIMNKYSELLNGNYEEIEYLRSKQLDAYYLSRKKKRNIKWYLRRIKPRYFFLLLNNKKNRKLFYKNIIKDGDINKKGG